MGTRRTQSECFEPAAIGTRRPQDQSREIPLDLVFPAERLEPGDSGSALIDPDGDVVANIAAKVMSNYANQIALTPLDDAFSGLADDLPYREGRIRKTA